MPISKKNGSPKDQLISDLLAYAKKKQSASVYALFSKFVPLYYRQSDVLGFEDASVENLFEMAQSHFSLFKERQPTECKLRVFNLSPEDARFSAHTIIELVVDDAPFLVDSVQTVLNEMRLTTHLMLHTGGIKVARDAQGKLTDIYSDEAPEDVLVDAPICVEIDYQDSPKAIAEIQDRLCAVLHDVAVVVRDFDKMKARLSDTIDVLSASSTAALLPGYQDSIDFLKWILSDHFIFLGARDYKRSISQGEVGMRLVSKSGLGVLENDKKSKVFRKYADLPASARKAALSPDPLLILSQTNTRSTVHRSEYTVYIGVKILDALGEVIEERRFIGLYTSSAYATHPKDIPLIRNKVESIISAANIPRRGHSGKELMHILASFPRDDLFQATPEELYPIVMGILHLQERKKLRLFVRKDVYHRYISCLVFLPKENFNTDVRNQMMRLLERTFESKEVNFDTYLSSSSLARLHFNVRLDDKKKIKYDIAALESQLAFIAISWHDEFRAEVVSHFGEDVGNKLSIRYRHVFPASYREAFSPESVVTDIEHIERLSDDHILEMSFYHVEGVAESCIHLKLFCLNKVLVLSDMLPMLENMGLRVIEEHPHELSFSDGNIVRINDFIIGFDDISLFDSQAVRALFEAAFCHVWEGKAESDAFNHLVLKAQLDWREVTMLRAYAKYLKQIGFTYSPEYIAEILVNYPHITQLLRDLFVTRFTLDKGEKSAESILTAIESALDEVSVLDADRILRRYVDLILATLRTNFYQQNAQGQPKDYVSFKLAPGAIPDLPLPLPKYETFVYSPRFEGVHLRSDQVARGGIRWSDRREDFRTEVLGLMKAQSVKNAVIVPAGAKGGFVPKMLPAGGTREAILEEGIACYRGFIQGLLDLADNLESDQIIPPKQVVCHDQPDSYLVVAADKGTATFSDIANAIAIDRGYWLGDAFASGGATGYDHKKMGITARGAWVSAQRHFQEMGMDLSQTEVTVVGIGDMSGDVFGNGLLSSPHLKLVAAFNHQHIFLDPNPNPTTSFKERSRLFHLPRSSWADYQPKALSQGGGVFSRLVKSIPLTPEVKTLLGVTEDELMPHELIQRILQAPVDMIWNGGIGTYVKSSQESNEQVGDKANDILRVNGRALRAKVVCEGGNLGLTQLGRIEYELAGGRVNSDFIDNSAGVDCSDHEVNIKILLNTVMRDGELTLKARNSLLAKMSDEVAELVLKNNYDQTRAIGLAVHQSEAKLGLYQQYLDEQVAAGKINRTLEFLPAAKDFVERKAAKKGLTRPEMSVLFAYSKILIEKDIRHSSLVTDPFFKASVFDAFPAPLKKRYADYVSTHRLHREIISTQVSNKIVSDMGLIFHYRMQSELNVSTEEVVRAYTVASHIYQMDVLLSDVEQLDYAIDPVVQMEMTSEVIQLVRRASRWFLRNQYDLTDIAETIAVFAKPVAGLMRRLPKLILGADKSRLAAHRQALLDQSVPEDVADSIAACNPMYHALNIIDAAHTVEADPYQVAKVYFVMLDRLKLLWFREQINVYPVESHWSVLVKSCLKADLDTAQRKLALSVFAMDGSAKTVTSKMRLWFETHAGFLNEWEQLLVEAQDPSRLHFEFFSCAVRKLLTLAESIEASYNQ